MGAAVRVGATVATCALVVVAWWASGAHADLGLRPVRTLVMPLVACVVLGVVLAYSARKYLWPYANRLMPRPVDYNEREARAHQRIVDLQRALHNRAVTPAAARRKAARIVGDSGLQLYYRPELWEAEEHGGTSLRVRLARRAWIGDLRGWLRVHVHVGIVLVVLFLLHAGASFRQPVGSLAEVLLFGALLTGLLGVAVHRWLPRILTRIEGERSPGDVDRVAWLLELRASEVEDDPRATAELRAQLQRVRAVGSRLRWRARFTDGWRSLHIVAVVAWVVVAAVHGLSHWVY